MTDCYIRMTVDRYGNRPVELVWNDTFKRWHTEANAEDLGFRGVSRLTSNEAFHLIAQMKGTGFFNDQPSGDAEISIAYHDNRQIYVLFDWDEEEGIAEPVAKIRCNGHGAALKFFRRNYDCVQKDCQVLHISDAWCKHHWDAIADLDLEDDSIKRGW